MARPSDKAKEIRDFQSVIMGTDVPESIRQNICVECGKPATEFKNEVSRREFSISGLCQLCQDTFFTKLSAYMKEEEL